MTESRAIAKYLAMKYGEGKLLPNPSDIQAIAMFDQAASTEQVQFDQVATNLIFEKVVAPCVHLLYIDITETQYQSTGCVVKQ